MSRSNRARRPTRSASAIPAAAPSTMSVPPIELLPMRPATGWNPCKRLRTFRTPVARVEAIPERVSRYFAPGHVDVDVSHWAVHGDLLGRLTAAILRGRRARLQAPPRTIPAMRGLGPRLLRGTAPALSRRDPAGYSAAV